MGHALQRSHPGHHPVSAGHAVTATATTVNHSRGWGALILALTIRAVVSPRVARALLVVAWRFRARRWFARPPFLPLPSGEYVRWRLYTAYGDERAVPPVADVIRYAHWASRTS